MKVNKASPFFLICLAWLVLCRCDTAGTVDSPAKSYFVKYIGGEGAQTGVDFEVNPDGSFILLGTTIDPLSSTTGLYLVKVDAQGNLVWEKTFGGPLNKEARDIELASDGRIVVVGNTVVSPGNRDIFLMTLSPDGAKIDSVAHTFKNVFTNQDTDDDANSVTQTLDGFIVAGSTENIRQPSDANFKRLGLVLRVNDNLTKYLAPWRDPPGYGQGEENVTTKIFQMGDSSFYCFGYSKWSSLRAPQTDFDFWYFRLGNKGDPKNSGAFGSANMDEKLRSVAFIPDQLGGGFFLGGIVTSQSGDDDVYYTRLRNPLDFLPSDPFDGFAPAPLGYNLGKLKNELVNVSVSQESGYFILTNETSTGNNNLFLEKIGVDGKKEWTSPAIFGGQGDDFVGAVRELSDGKIAVFGTMSIGGDQNGETKMVLMKVNKSGQFAD